MFEPDDSDRLKPCPFCGGDAEWNHNKGNPALMDDPMAGATWIDCTKCGASTNLRYSLMDDCRPLLLEQWNRRAPPAPPTGQPSDERPYSGWKWQHIKSGGEYTLLGDAKLQADQPLEDMAEVYVYQGDDGRMWVRPVAEFNARFKRVRPLSAQSPAPDSQSPALALPTQEEIDASPHAGITAPEDYLPVAPVATGEVQRDVAKRLRDLARVIDQANWKWILRDCAAALESPAKPAGGAK